jgi:hypothetical protein
MIGLLRHLVVVLLRGGHGGLRHSFLTAEPCRSGALEMHTDDA